jgi:hypothetical protein
MREKSYISNEKPVFANYKSNSRGSLNPPDDESGRDFNSLRQEYDELSGISLKLKKSTLFDDFINS